MNFYKMNKTAFRTRNRIITSNQKVPHSHLMHCNLTKSPDPEFQLLPLTGYVTLDKLFSLGEPIIWEK